MPLYEVEHCFPLREEERDQLAEAITRIHATTFCTPSLFVNVRFTDVSQQKTYVGGKKRSSNRIIGYLRSGGPRSKADFDNVAEQLKAAWDTIVQNGDSSGEDREMRLVVIQGSIVAGLECGFHLPSAGEDVAWLKKHKNEFEEIAQSGDADFEALVHEMKTREDLVKSLKSQ